MDIVYIQQLRASSVIGVYDWERTIRQELLLDVEMAWDNRPAATGDKLAQALDYDAVAQRLTNHIEQSECLLIETLAEQCAAIVLGEFAVPWVRLRLAKPGAVANAGSVGVVIERGEPG